MFKNFHKNKYNSGITLVELLVVMAIFMMITTIAIFNYNKFDSSISTQNLADDIALTIRKAQSYAIGVRGLNNEFKYKYGVHFTTNPTPGTVFDGSNTSFIFFVDMNNSFMYEHDNQCGNPGTLYNDCLEVLNITSADLIKEVYRDKVATSPDSSTNIFFKRPNLEPTFYDGDSGEGEELSIPSVTIKVSNQDDLTGDKFITIYNNGQISVSNSFNLE